MNLAHGFPAFEQEIQFKSSREPVNMMHFDLKSKPLKPTIFLDFQLWMNYVYEVEIAVEGEKRTTEAGQTQPRPASRVELYQALDSSKQQTRLLLVHVGKPQNSLRCSMEIISFDNSTHEDYKALSYCLGAESRDATVQVQCAPNLHGEDESSPFQDLAINKSLHEALTHLRPIDGPASRFWADAI